MPLTLFPFPFPVSRDPMTSLNRSLLLSAAALLVATTTAQAAVPDETGGYFTASVAAVLSAHGGDLTVSPGGGVRIPGTQALGRGRDLALAVGREFRHEREGDEPLHTRLELQLRDLAIDRNGASLGVLQPRFSDRLQARALFVDGLVRIARTENTRWWAGAGIGVARVEVPGALGATPGCSCLNPATGSGLAWQVRLLGERPVSADGAVFGEAGYVRLPAGASSGLPSTGYGRVGAFQLGAGWRSRF